MATDVHNRLVEQQTGEPTPEKQKAIISSNAPEKAPVDEISVLNYYPDESYLHYDPRRDATQQDYYGVEATMAGYGNSRFDTTFDPNQNIEDRRARNQSGFNKILNGVMRGGVTTASTLASTTLGLLDGMVEGGIELGRQFVTGDERDFGKAVGAGVDNLIVRNMNNLQELSKEIFPGYRTIEEQSEDYQKHWLRHIGAANSVATFLENFGFTLGALGGGQLTARALRSVMRRPFSGNVLRGMTAAASGDKEATAILKNTFERIGNAGNLSVIEQAGVNKMWKRAANGLNKFNAENQLFGNILAAMGEGMIEGEMARKEFMESHSADLNNRFLQEYDSLEQNLIDSLKASSDPNDRALLRAVPVIDESGNVTQDYELNDLGLSRLATEQRNLANKYNQQRQWAEDQGDKLAATTYLLNIPILTVSNTVEFGRAFSRGFNTARKNISKVAGGIAKDGAKITAEYTQAAAAKLPRILKKTAKVGLAEASEEMLQGTVSSGATKVADDRLTSFNDDGYDRNSLRALTQDWFASMAEGGGEYLSDWKNWQEGFMGLVTGLLGMPTSRHNVIRSWGGGVLGAINEVRNEDEASKRAAEVLNREVNKQEFQDAIKGWARHGKYDRQMQQAAIENDKYAWETASDLQKVSDVIMFADAGRLQDLYDLADYYANMTPEQAQEQGVPEATATSATAEEVKNNPQEAISKVKAEAEKMKADVQLYNDMYDAMTTLAPMGASPEHVKEMVATAMNIKKFEERFLGLYDSLIKDLDMFVKPLSAITYKGKDIEDEKKQAERAKEIYTMLTDVFTNLGRGTVFTPKSVQDLMNEATTLGVIDEAVHSLDKKELTTKYEDLKKIATDRRNFLNKLITLRDITPEKFNEQATNADKEREDVNKENVNAATEGLETYSDIKSRYYGIEDTKRPDFVDMLRTKASSHEPTANFVKTYDTYQNFREALAQSNPGIVNKTKGGFSNVAEVILEDAFEKATDEKSLLDALENPMSLDAVHEGLQRRLEAEKLKEDEVFPPLVNQQYAAAEQAIKSVASQFKASSQNTQGRENLQKQKNTPPPTPAQDAGDNDNDNPPASTRPTVSTNEKSGNTSATKTPEGQSAAASQENNDNPESREKTDKLEGESDSNASYTDNTPTEEESYRRDRNGAAKMGCYQQTLPEVPINTMKEIRQLLEDRKGADREQMRAIDALLYSINRDDFVQFDEQGNPIGGEVEYASVYKWLKDRGAFEYISTKLSVNDEVVFTIPKDGPEYDGEKLIVVSVVTARNSDGDITSVQPLTTLHAKDKSGRYMYLDELYDAIQADYESQPVGGDLYVFGGLRNPKTSKVFAKQPGIMRYNHSEEGQRIDKIPSYDSSSPIIILDNDNNPVALRGNPDLSKVFLPLVYEWSTPHNGRVYYLVKNGKDSYTPIFVDKVGVTSDMIRNAADGSFLSDVRDLMQKMDTLLQGVTPENLQARSENLLKGINRIASYVNLDGISINFIQTPEGIKLHVEWGKSDSEQMDFNPGDTVLPLFDRTNIPVRLSAKDKWIGASRRNLDRIIQDGLLTSDVRELRQVGVNMLYDPWNPETGKFERVLPSAFPESKQSVPKTGAQKIAADAELGETMQDVLPIAPRTFKTAEPVTTDTGASTLDDLFGDDNEEVPEYQRDYEDLSDATKKLLEQKQVSEKTWNARDDAFRKHVLNCA